VALTFSHAAAMDPLRRAYVDAGGFCSIGVTGLQGSPHGCGGPHGGPHGSPQGGMSPGAMRDEAAASRSLGGDAVDVPIVCHLRRMEGLAAHDYYSAFDVAVLSADVVLVLGRYDDQGDTQSTAHTRAARQVAVEIKTSSSSTAGAATAGTLKSPPPRTKTRTWYGRTVVGTLEELIVALDGTAPPSDGQSKSVADDESEARSDATTVASHYGRIVIGVMGAGSSPYEELAAPVGRWIYGQGWSMINGGGGGVMTSTARAFAAAAAEAAEAAKTPHRRRLGVSVGILKCHSREDPTVERAGYPNDFVDIAIRTPLPHSGMRGTGPLTRNHFNVLSPDVIIILPGGPGTLSEAKLARSYGRPVVAYLGPTATVAKRPIPCKSCRCLTPRCLYVADLAALGIPIARDFAELKAEVAKLLPRGTGE
jgi:predicted Rossmann-fold nucleotide-binding protein